MKVMNVVSTPKQEAKSFEIISGIKVDLWLPMHLLPLCRQFQTCAVL